MARDAPSQERTLYLYLKNERTLRAGGSEARLLSELLFDAYEARAEAGRGNGASRPEITRDHPRLGVDEASQGQGGDEPGTGGLRPSPALLPIAPLPHRSPLSLPLPARSAAPDPPPLPGGEPKHAHAHAKPRAAAAGAGQVDDAANEDVHTRGRG